VVRNSLNSTSRIGFSQRGQPTPPGAETGEKQINDVTTIRCASSDRQFSLSLFQVGPFRRHEVGNMIRALTCIGILALVLGAAFGQSAEITPSFEIADVHASLPVPLLDSRRVFMRSGFYGGGRYEVQNATMIDLVRPAYGVDPDKVLGGPNWLLRMLPGDTKASDASTGDRARGTETNGQLSQSAKGV
jgi:hypothetical protein